MKGASAPALYPISDFIHDGCADGRTFGAVHESIGTFERLRLQPSGLTVQNAKRMKYNRSNITTGVQREWTASLAGVIVAYRARLSGTAGGDV